jgi:hypothetical protein
LSIADKETVLMTFSITDKGSIGFVVSGSNGIQSVDIPGFKTEELNRLLFEPDERRFILPSGGLFLLPLHVVPLSDGQPLCQRYYVSYAPSIQLLREMQNKAEIIEGKGFYAVINPGEDPALVFSGCEG